ncbi:MAG: MBL fold metallo-hydrolase [Nocardioidaceae bacterium]|nr:MBL fold metallo-hydrolase [Nocardioidaceae bacterium]
MPRHTETTSSHSLTFIGNATTILQLGSFTLMTDPNFLRKGQRAYLGKGLWSRRLHDPALSVDKVPTLDAIVLSHLHGDHWDRVARAGLDRSSPLITTTHAARRLAPQGFATQGLRTWEDHVLTRGGEEVRVTSMPGIHAKGALRRVLPAVMGSLLEHSVAGQPQLRVYISGDTLTGDHLDAVHERFPDIDVAIVHLGGTRILASTVTMDAPQGVDFLRRVAPRSAIPVHYDDYKVMRSPLSAFLQQADRAQLGDVVRPVKRGETVDLVSAR